MMVSLFVQKFLKNCQMYRDVYNALWFDNNGMNLLQKK